MMMEGVRMGACQRATAPSAHKAAAHTGAGSGGWGFWPPLCLVNMEGRPGGGGGWRVAWWNSGQQGLPENQSTSGMSKDTQAGLLEEGTHSRDER